MSVLLDVPSHATGLKGGGGVEEGKQTNGPEVACHRVNLRNRDGTKATLAGMISLPAMCLGSPRGDLWASHWSQVGEIPARTMEGDIYDRSRSTRTDQTQHSHAGDVAVVKRLSPCDRTPSRARRWAMYSSWVCLFLNILQHNKSKGEGERNQQICLMTFYRGPARYSPLPASGPAQLTRDHPPLREHTIDWSLETLRDIYVRALHLQRFW